MDKTYLLELRSDPRFQSLVEEVKRNVPKLPEYNPENDNTEDWKYTSGTRDGYKLCMLKFFNMEINDE